MSSKKKQKGKNSKKMRAPPRQQPAREQKSRGPSASSIGGDIGSALGGYVAPGIGSVLGRAAGSGLGYLFSKLTGHGDYKIVSNTLSLPGSPVPSFGENCIRIRHKEYLGDVYGSTGFVLASYDINPGLSAAFPWLSSIAANYQEFAFAGLVYSFVSTSADALNSTNTALGKVLLATDYNPLNPSFTTPTQMLATEYSNYGKPADSIMHAVECSAKMRPTLWQFVRTAGVPPGADERLYDLGNFQIASQGMQATANIGGLWVTYDVILCKPVVAPAGRVFDQWLLPAVTNAGIQTTNFGANTSLRPVGATLTNASGTTVLVTLPNNLSGGVYRVEMQTYATTGATAYLDFALASANFGLSAKYSSDGLATHQGYPGSNTTGYYMQHDYTITAAGATLTLTTPVSTAAQTTSIIMTLYYLGP
jgi:hypothetical protein